MARPRPIDRATGGISRGRGRVVEIERVGELLALRDRLVQVMGSAEAAHEWLHSASRYLGDFTPAEALKAGRIDRVGADLNGLTAARREISPTFSTTS